MPGIVGIAGSREAIASAPSVADMAAAITRVSWHSVSKLEAEGFACAAVSLEEASPIAEGPNAIVTFDGSIYGDHGKLTAADLLKRYEADGIEGVQSLNGIYVAVVFDKTTKTLSLVTDRLGYLPFYYWVNGDSLMFSSEYKTFLLSPDFKPRTRAQSIVQYLQLTYVYAPNTLLEGVHKLPSGGRLDWDGQNARTTIYEPLKLDRAANEERSIDDQADQYYEIVCESVRKRKTDNNFMLISGGLDSRALAAALVEVAGPGSALSCTLGYDQSYDVRFGKRIAKALGLDHRHLDVDETYMTKHLDAGIERLEGSLSAHGFWAFEADGLLEQRRGATVIHGLLGDILGGERVIRYRDYIKPLDEAGVRKDVYGRNYVSTFSDDSIPAIFKKEHHDEVVGYTWSRFNELMDACEGTEFFDRIEILDLMQRQRQFTCQQIHIYAELASSQVPFTDRSVMDFTFKQRDKNMAEKTMYKYMIKKHMPKVAGIPHTSTGLPLNRAPIPTLYWRGRNFFHYKVLPVASLGLVPHVHFGRWIQYDRWLREASQQRVRELLLDGEYLEDYLEMDEVRRWVEDHMAGKGDHYGQLSILMTLVAWRKRFNA